jgi:hypothetical protein
MPVRTKFPTPSPSLDERMVESLFPKDAQGSRVSDPVLETVAAAGMIQMRTATTFMHQRGEEADSDRTVMPLMRARNVRRHSARVPVRQ